MKTVEQIRRKMEDLKQQKGIAASLAYEKLLTVVDILECLASTNHDIDKYLYRTANEFTGGVRAVLGAIVARWVLEEPGGELLDEPTLSVTVNTAIEPITPPVNQNEKLRAIWRNIKARSIKEEIELHPHWYSFSNFQIDVGYQEGKRLHRINLQRGFTPDNVHWV